MQSYSKYVSDLEDQEAMLRNRSKSHNRSTSRSGSRSTSRLLSTGQMNPYTLEALGPRDDLKDDPAKLHQHLMGEAKKGSDSGESDEDGIAQANMNRNLAISFFSMVFVGLMNKVFNKLMTVPMHNYPNFLNLLCTFVYLPVCFSYIIPASYYGWIPQEQLDMPKKPFLIMGALDSLASILQIFATTFLSGPLVILLSQAAIPMSMIISRYLLKVQYNRFQYIGAVVVAGGIAVVLGPSMTGGIPSLFFISSWMSNVSIFYAPSHNYSKGDSPLWAIMMILSTIPMALSSVYKEIALGETELDPIFLNGWVAVFQFLFSIVIAVPASLTTGVAIPDLPGNMYDGLRCYVGISSYSCDDDTGDDCVSDSCNPQGPIFVNIYIIFNQAYNLLIILILKFGSANILFMALTIMVPLGNIAFTLPFVPEHSALAVTDIIGLVVIMGGLICYRFANDIYVKWQEKKKNKAVLDLKSDDTLVTRLNRESDVSQEY